MVHGDFFYWSPPTETMIKYTSPTQDTKEFFEVVKNSVIFCVSWVGPVYLVIFPVGGDQFHTFKTFLGGTSKKTFLYLCQKLKLTQNSLDWESGCEIIKKQP